MLAKAGGTARTLYVIKLAGRLRGLARLTHSPGIRRELADLAKRTTGAAIILTSGHGR
jgi:hypothetical protein